MKMFIPTIGTRLVLTEDWTFHLCFERRNQKFGEARGIVPPGPRTDWRKGWNQPEKAAVVTLPAGTILMVDRLYIRKGKSHQLVSRPLSDFDSLTFYAYDPNVPTKAKKPKSIGRFWAKLADVNTIECDVLDD